MRLIDADALGKALGFAEPCANCKHVYGMFLCDEEGYIKGKAPNVFGICGPVVVCRTKGEDFASVGEDEIAKLLKEFSE